MMNVTCLDVAGKWFGRGKGLVVLAVVAAVFAVAGCERAVVPNFQVEQVAEVLKGGEDLAGKVPESKTGKVYLVLGVAGELPDDWRGSFEIDVAGNKQVAEVGTQDLIICNYLEGKPGIKEAFIVKSVDLKGAAAGADFRVKYNARKTPEGLSLWVGYIGN